MIKRTSLVFKLAFFLSLSTAAIFLLIIAFNYFLAQRVITHNIRENAQNVALSAVHKIETTLAAVEKIADNVAFSLEERPLDRDQLVGYARMAVERNKELYGLGIAFEPYAFDKGALYFAPYYAREAEGPKLTYMGDASYDYFKLDWYQIARELGRPLWGEPYFDDVLMATYAVPFYEKTPAGTILKGVVCADISIEKLTDIVNSVKILKTGDAYLFSRNGMVMTHPVKDFILNETIFSLAEERKDRHLREIGRKMMRRESGFVPFVSIARHKKSWMYHTPVASTGWTLAVVFPEDELFEDIRTQAMGAGALGLIGLLLLLVAIIGVARSITGPLRRMATAAEAIGQGDLNAELPCCDAKDEVGLLAEAFGRMKVSLKDHIRKLTETTAAKERIESELNIAREIQTSILPRTFPAFPQRKEFDIYAMMEPAKEVGGDLYDFCLIDNKKLYFVIGDVSGKGVPAALFMMIAKTLLKNEALRGSSAVQVMQAVNNIIALDNSTAMFATVFCGILDIATGEVEFSNAGHNPPLLGRKGKGYAFLQANKGFVLGPMAGFPFKSEKITLAPGDTLFLYTDGVTEAMNADQELFSEQRLLAAVTRVQEYEPGDIVCALRQEIRGFVKDTPQSDDITMLVLRFKG